jgi:hypothetical protein
MEGAFDLAEREEIAMALALYHGFSKVLIALGLEPEPGTMSTTELPTPDTKAAFATLEEGFVTAEAAVDAACAAHTDKAAPALLAAVRARVSTLIGGTAKAVSAVHGMQDPHPAMAAWIDLAEMFVVDIHAVDDHMFAAAADPVGAELTTSLFVAMALADGRARLAVAGLPLP